MNRRMPDLAEHFENWLLRCVAEAVEGDEVSASLLTELHAAIAESRARPPEARERCLRRFVEAWLVQQRETYDADRHGGDDS